MNSWTANHCESVVSGDLSFSVQSLDPVLQSFAAMGWREIAGAGLLLYGCFNAHLAATSILGEILLEVFVESRLFPFVELHFTKYGDIVLVYFTDSDIRSGPVSTRDFICLQSSQVSLREVHTCLLLHILRGSDGWCSSCLLLFSILFISFVLFRVFLWQFLSLHPEACTQSIQSKKKSNLLERKLKHSWTILLILRLKSWLYGFQFWNSSCGTGIDELRDGRDDSCFHRHSRGVFQS